MGFGGSEVTGVLVPHTALLTRTNHHRTCTAGPAAPVAPAAATAAMPREHMRNHACHLKLPGAAVPALRDVLV
ncbi:hypothetical protein HaLaN_30671 [Haematococcus lacustris]|uniref:Uncharacterized protein n=1 Tax=Haematococcus lacustris TaxID=44745 RepID=A0A6A0AI83_HAELA|nr:hypothetical protein HaLaN_30671 [Haematococcus lacustris]